MSVLYFIVLVFILFQTKNETRKMLEFVFPELEGMHIEDKVRGDSMLWSELNSSDI